MGRDWDCECSEDFGACENHRDVLAQREGAASRTADDLVFVFLEDVLVIADAREEGTDAPTQLEGLRESVTYWGDDEKWTDNYGCRWVREELTAEGIQIADEIMLGESVLADLGLSVDWDDGYVISRYHADCPLLHI